MKRDEHKKIIPGLIKRCVAAVRPLTLLAMGTFRHIYVDDSVTFLSAQLSNTLRFKVNTSLTST